MVCYRHPDREAYVRCQRCERFICPECQYEAAVGFLCPEDAGRDGIADRVERKAPAAVRNRVQRARTGDRPMVTTTIIIICTLVWLAQLVLPNDWVTVNFAYVPLATVQEPWRMLTAGFLHDTGNFLHLGLNMYTLWIFGRELEPLLGRGRFATLYFTSIFGGSVAVLWLNDPTTWVLGASGAIFGLMAAYFVVLRSLGGNTSQIMFVIAFNLAFGFFVSGISWQAHLGGMITGALIALVYSRTRQASSKNVRNFGVGAVAVALIALTVIGVFMKLPTGIF